MLPTHVALVPYEDGLVEPDPLLRVVAALQIQLTRDFTPVWGTPAVVSAFMSLEEVPPACIPLVLVSENSLLQRDHAFHTTVKGQPIGLVEKAGDWSLAASHELLETVCDPQGKRKVSGMSMADSAKHHLERWAKPYEEQGEVQYLLEVCDPCQDTHYLINGVKVSDFVTPRYYVPGAPSGESYSFTGVLKEPLDLLGGGYITWYTSIKDSPVWQAKKDKAGKLRIGPMTIPAPGSSRRDIDYASDLHADVTPPPRKPTAARAAPAGTGSSRGGGRYGAELRADVASVLSDLYVAQADAELADLVKLLKDLASDKNNLWTDCNANKSGFRAKALKARLGRTISYSGDFPTRPQFEVAYQQAKELLGRRASMKVSGQFAALQMQGQT